MATVAMPIISLREGQRTLGYSVHVYMNNLIFRGVDSLNGYSSGSHFLNTVRPMPWAGQLALFDSSWGKQ